MSSRAFSEWIFKTPQNALHHSCWMETDGGKLWSDLMQDLNVRRKVLKTDFETRVDSDFSFQILARKETQEGAANAQKRKAVVRVRMSARHRR
jgi:hypothetical protein